MSMKRFFGNSQYGGRTVFHGILVGKPNKNSLVLELLKGSIQLMDHQSKPHIIWVGYLQQFNITGEGEFFFYHPTLNSIHSVNLSSEIFKKKLEKENK